MLKVLGVVVGVLILPPLAFGQADQGAGTSPRGAVPPPQPASVAAPPRPTLAPTKKIDATYPDKAKRAGVQGDVWLDVIVLADGTVKSVTIAKSLDTVFGLDQAAIAAIRQWVYPPLTDGRATRPPVRVVIPFRLPGAPAAVSVATLEEFGKDAFHPVGRDPRVVLPKLKHQVTPVYTTAGLRAKIVGSVEAEAVVLPDGTVGQVRVVKSLDQPTGLDDQALGAAREWMFEPGTLDGKPVPMIVAIVLNFSLR
jgi:TonB family protein